MATLVLQAVGATIGSVFGPVGSAIGSAVGSAVGYAVDNTIINSFQHIEGARLSGARAMSAEEGTPVARVYGYSRVTGTVIWATQLREKRSTERQGAKGGPKVTTYSYSASMAVGLCEGKIGGIKRVWADGKEIDLTQTNYRIYHGDFDQLPDPLIEAKQGQENAPAYLGLAYIVFEDLQLERFGNRLPQIQVEVIRPVGSLEQSIEAISVIPGATEHGLDPTPILAKIDGETIELNRHQLYSETDWIASIDELQAVCQNLQHVSLVLAWYGDDLRANQTRVRPGVMSREGFSEKRTWRVSGQERGSADTHLISKTSDNASAFGGTPNDQSVIDAIADLKNRGIRVTLNPFVLMDIAPDNQLPDPAGDSAQPAYPWRGRISCFPGIGQINTPDKTDIASAQIDAFMGGSEPGNLTDFGYRRMILHYAELSVQAGGVDAIIIGSELVGLTSIRDADNGFPFVEALRSLAKDVRTIVGPDCKIVYGADWSEYFGYHPQDGSGDVFFHLDNLWADDNIDAIAIDYYMPLSDWRSDDVNDIGKNSDGLLWQSDIDGFKRSIEGGEGFDWYYASLQDRRARIRTPITDGAYGKPWVFRYKDLRSWWSNLHYNRIGGVEADIPTAWIPESKPIWFTELGCASVDLGAREPNAFADSKSSEGRLPYGSKGLRDDDEQRNYIKALHDYWSAPENNPISPLFGGSMVATERFYNWAWDARPFPMFPNNKLLWADGDNWARGHWLNGKLGTGTIEGVVTQIFKDHELDLPDISHVSGALAGITVSAPSSARATLEPLLTLCGIHAVDDHPDTVFKLQGDQAYQVNIISAENLAETPGEPLFVTERAQVSELPSEVTFTFRDSLDNYRTATCYSRRIENATGGQFVFNAPANIDFNAARSFANSLLSKLWTGKSTCSFSLPYGFDEYVNGQVIAFADKPDRHWQIMRTSVDTLLEVHAREIEKPTRIASFAERDLSSSLGSSAGGYFGDSPTVLPLDLPSTQQIEGYPSLHFAAFSKGQTPQSVFSSPEADGFQYNATIPGNAAIGQTLAPVEPGVSGRIDNANELVIEMKHGEFSSISDALLLSGRNLLALRSDAGSWEIVQYRTAQELQPNVWQLSELLRGQGGTEDAMLSGASAGAPVVMLDERVGKVSIEQNTIGLETNYRIGPTGKEFSDRFFTTLRTTGGLRALKPLSPVHIRAELDTDSWLKIAWIRRGRLDADDWAQQEIPLAESEENYRCLVYDAQDMPIFDAVVSTPHVRLEPQFIEENFDSFPEFLKIKISQISQRVGEGVAAFVSVPIHH